MSANEGVLANLGAMAIPEVLKEYIPAQTEDVSDISIKEVHFQHIDALKPFLAVAENLHDANTKTAPLMLSKLSLGLRKSGDVLAIAQFNYKKARAERKRTEAVVAIDEFPAWVKETGNKSTDKMRDFFVLKHPDVLKAMENEALYEAIQVQVYTMKQEISLAITTIRMVAYGFKDQALLSNTD